MNRCLNDPFGYCAGEPKRYFSEGKQTAYDLEGRAHLEKVRVRLCRHDHHTCGQYLTQTELCTLTIE
ncbi:hypothetical protein ES708_12619 [subsurface metagenome]